jgi:tripartite-type tricarboxylate transporter receptor subunit TctC
MTLFVRVAIATLLLVSLSAAAPAQQYPSGPIAIALGFAPGGTTDILARLAGEVLQTEFKQSVVVENRTGGGGVIANTSVARAAPDGQTLLLAPTAFLHRAVYDQEPALRSGPRPQAHHADGLHR